MNIVHLLKLFYSVVNALGYDLQIVKKTNRRIGGDLL